MRLILLLLLIIHSVPVLASGLVTRFKHLSIDDGLSQNSVYSMLQDRHGFLWFATDDGLNRYDGYEFKIFRHDPKDPSSISNNRIAIIYQDASSTLWVGTANGLNRYDHQTQRFERFSHQENDTYSLSDDDVKTILEDNQQRLWIGTSEGLNRFDPQSGRFTRFEHDPSDRLSLSHNQVRSIFQDNRDVLWVGTFGGGLNRLEARGGFTHFKHDSDNPNSLSNDHIYTIFQDHQSVLWLGTQGGLNRFDHQTGHFSHFKHESGNLSSLSHNNVTAINEDSKGRLWLGTFGGGLNRLGVKRESFIRFKHSNGDPHSLSSDSVFSLFQDSNKALWVGTEGAGLNKYDILVERFGLFRQLPLLSNKSISAIHEDRQGYLWIGTFNSGLNRFDRRTGKIKQFKHQKDMPNSLSSDNIYALFEDEQGILWIGTSGGGLNRYDAQTDTFEHFINDPADAQSLSHNNIFTIVGGRNGTFWVGTRNGLNRFDVKTRRFYRLGQSGADAMSLRSEMVYALVDDGKGSLWVGTDGGGLSRLDTKEQKFEHFYHQQDNADSISNDTVIAIHIDSKGALWLGTFGGLNRYDVDTGKFTRYTELQGLANDVVYGILEDDKGHLWLSTNNGLSRFDPIEEVFKNYNVNDGLQSNEFNFKAYHKNSAGELFFGGINGFNQFYPGKITDDTQVPPVMLTEFLLANQPVSVTGSPHLDELSDFALPQAIDALDELVLNHEQNVMSFEFAALHYANPMKNRYAYQLKGWDKDWVYTGAKKRWATYTNIPAGNYILRVKAGNKDGYWNEEGHSLKITLLPPPWKTWWAYTIYVLLLATPVLAYIHAQRRKYYYEHEINLELERKVAVRTAELVQKNQEVEQKNREIIETQQHLVQTEKMASLGTLTAGIAHELNNPTNFVHVSVQTLRVDLEAFQKFLFELAGDNAEQTVLDSFRAKFQPLYEHLSTIKDGSARIKNIVQDLRVFTQLDAADKKTVVLTDCLRSTINLVKTKKSNVAEFLTEFEGEPELFCYPAQLNQVFMNLLLNGCDAIREKQLQQNIKEPGKVIVSCAMEGKSVKVSVRDSGCGMSSQNKAKMFEPFYTTKEVGEGTGLGLAVSYRIVQKHGGSLTVESKEGEGSTFTLTLPV